MDAEFSSATQMASLGCLESHCRDTISFWLRHQNFWRNKPFPQDLDDNEFWGLMLDLQTILNGGCRKVLRDLDWVVDDAVVRPV